MMLTLRTQGSRPRKRTKNQTPKANDLILKAKFKDWKVEVKVNVDLYNALL